MTYVITEPCIGTKEELCVDVCPAACIHTTPDAPQNYIDPDVCIECEQCVLVCPVNAIFLDKEVPDEWLGYVQVNAAFFQQHKTLKDTHLDTATHLVHGVQDYANRAGLRVATVVLNRAGQQLTASAMNGADPEATANAYRKAYTALLYRLGTHQIGRNQAPPGDATLPIAQEQVLIAKGGLPLVEQGEIIGAIGVAGAPTDEQDMLCCQAGLGVLTASH